MQCDDGNLINGDGCSSVCTIEYGYICEKRHGLPDLCIDTIPPKATLKVTKGNILVISFSKPVISSANSINYL